MKSVPQDTHHIKCHHKKTKSNARSHRPNPAAISRSRFHLEPSYVEKEKVVNSKRIVGRKVLRTR